MDRLLEGVPEEQRNAGDARWLLAQLLNWHRREDRSFWWRYYALLEKTDQERVEEPDAIGMLTFLETRPDDTPRRGSGNYRFTFPPQEHKVRAGSSPRDPSTGKSAGVAVAVDDIAGTVDLRIRDHKPFGPSADPLVLPPPWPTSLIPFDYVRPAPRPESLQRLARWVIANGVDAPGEFRAARDLLMRRPPQVDLTGKPAETARRAVLALDHGYLAIQGPPGSGKSTVGAQMIVNLVEAGKKVGVTANSHKVIDELLDKVASEARRRGVTFGMGHRGDGQALTAADTEHLSNEQVRDRLADGSLQVAGGTGWLWAREEMGGSVDYLFVDEAGQMSLADAIAASQCAENLVLLGDPQQLDQPLQGTHPPGADRSALAHLLGKESVMPAGLGLFLDGTWRLHPSIAAYTSEVFYREKLHSQLGCELSDLAGVSPLSGTGMRFVAVPHTGNSSESPEEVAEITGYVRALLASSPTRTDASGQVHPLSERDILIITPYNAQVAALQKALPGFRIGTVDKFQGQEAPISIYSMATSSPEEAPRGMEFLYSLNRLNVATSRAQCLAVVVASPALLRVGCRTPRQMQLANALARLVEVAT